MRRFEKVCLALRHNRFLRHFDRLWNLVRPPYNKLISTFGRNGLERLVNGTDQLRVLAEHRGLRESYEPEVWTQLMAAVRQCDVVADVGAYIGLYSVALAKRVGPSGKVFAFEPDPKNFRSLEAHCRLNKVTDWVKLVPTAVGERESVLPFVDGHESQSHVGESWAVGTQFVNCVRLDDVFSQGRLDVLKIDVEGYEEKVLRGARQLLQDGRAPRVIYIEVHPYAWQEVGTTSTSLIEVLDGCGYDVMDLRGEPVAAINWYGEIVARKRSSSI